MTVRTMEGDLVLRDSGCSGAIMVKLLIKKYISKYLFIFSSHIK